MRVSRSMGCLIQRGCCQAVVLATLLAGCANAPVQEWPGGKVFGELAYQKQRGEELAARVKQSVAPGQPQYQQSEMLYGEARLRYNAYAQQLLADYIANRASDLSASASAAASAGEAFSSYVAKNVASRGVDEALDAAKKVTSFGFGVYDQYRKDLEDKRRAAAAEIQPQIQWRTWSEVGLGGSPANP